MTSETPNVRTLAVLHSSGEGDGDTVLRVVSWNELAPVLEKRMKVMDKARGIVRMGRLIGLSLEDVVYVVTHWPDVQRLMFDADKKNSGQIQ